jgi:hypothetical protein
MKNCEGSVNRYSPSERGMSCPSCKSGNQAEFTSEMIIHFAGLRNIDNPGVLLFSKVSVCLDFGFLRGIVPASELALVTKGSPNSECSTGEAAHFEIEGAETVRRATHDVMDPYST